MINNKFSNTCVSILYVIESIYNTSFYLLLNIYICFDYFRKLRKKKKNVCVRACARVFILRSENFLTLLI